MSSFMCPGLSIALQEPVETTEVEDEIDGEREASNAWEQLRTEAHSDVDSQELIVRTLDQVIENASRVVTDATDHEYRRLMKVFEVWLNKKGYIKCGHDVFGDVILDNMPEYIAAWIMEECDEIRLDGTAKPPTEYRASYSQAMKMRASMTYGFGRLKLRGIHTWTKNDNGTRWQGNPSMSTQVSRYMVSLKRRKVRNGETAMSSRAITAEVLKALWIFNHQPDHWTIRPYEPGSRDNQDLHCWGGGRARRLLHCAYTIAFWCLLRFDEVLQIQIHDIELVSSTCIKLTLPFRKTHQNGGVKPFYLHILHSSERHLCPVRAFAEWYAINGKRLQHGYIFRRIVSGDRVNDENTPLRAEEFLEMFRNNLLDIKVDPHPYGTHSFRRGGCQYLSSERRWGLRKLCDWGGWSVNFTSLTIVKYLISWNDNPLEPREEFLNPNRLPALRCPQCGRSCHCA